MSDNIYGQKTKYTKSLADVMSVMEDYGEIAYARSTVTGEEYLRISDKIGSVLYLDVTAESMEDMLKDVAKVILSSEIDVYPKGIITDKPKLRTISSMFRR